MRHLIDDVFLADEKLLHEDALVDEAHAVPLAEDAVESNLGIVLRRAQEHVVCARRHTGFHHTLERLLWQCCTEGAKLFKSGTGLLLYRPYPGLPHGFSHKVFVPASQ